MGRSRYKFTQNDLPHFVTCTVINWIPVFTRPETVGILIRSLEYLRSEGLKVYAYVILENHLHMVVQSGNISRDMARFKSHTAHELVQYLADNKIKTILDQLKFYKKNHKNDRYYQFWQEGVHPEWIQNDEMMRQKIEYIHYNPVKRGYVDKPEHWCYSSARCYLGLEGLFEVTTQW